jgi:hypothetical protein
MIGIGIVTQSRIKVGLALCMANCSASQTLLKPAKLSYHLAPWFQSGYYDLLRQFVRAVNQTLNATNNLG